MNKQIEEMASDLENHTCMSQFQAEIASRTLYQLGYRKQKEAGWIVCGMFDDFLKCSSCGYDTPWQTAIEHKFCPNCGARMKGDERK